MYAAWLTNTDGSHYKHYFVLCTTVKVGGDKMPVVKVAWGRIGKLNDDRTYEGPKGSEFTGYPHAERYARKIVAVKIQDEGYEINWSIDSDKVWPELESPYPNPSGRLLHRFSGEEPRWWNDAMSLLQREREHISDIKPKSKQMKLKFPIKLKKPKATVKWKKDPEDGDDDDDVTPQVNKKGLIDKFKEKLRKLSEDEDDDDKPTRMLSVEEEANRILREDRKSKKREEVIVHAPKRKPRFEYVPRKGR